MCYWSCSIPQWPSRGVTGMAPVSSWGALHAIRLTLLAITTAMLTTATKPSCTDPQSVRRVSPRQYALQIEYQLWTDRSPIQLTTRLLPRCIRVGIAASALVLDLGTTLRPVVAPPLSRQIPRSCCNRCWF